MSTKKSLYVNFATTVGTANFAWLNKPDVGSEYSDGKYKVTIAFQKDDPMVAVLKATIKEAAQREFGDTIPAGFHNPLRDGDESGKEQLAGMVFVAMKSINKPTTVDAANKELPDSVIIMSGDTIRCAGSAKAYNGKNKGVSFYLDMVKLIAKNNSGGGPGEASDVFGEDAGFVAESFEPSGSEQPAPQQSSKPSKPNLLDINDL